MVIYHVFLMNKITKYDHHTIMNIHSYAAVKILSHACNRNRFQLNTHLEEILHQLKKFPLTRGSTAFYRLL